MLTVATEGAPTPPPMSLGLRIRLARVRLRLSLAEVERRTGIGYTMLSKYEHDKAIPTVERLLVLARELHTSPNDLLGYSGDSVTASQLSGEDHLVAA